MKEPKDKRTKAYKEWKGKQPKVHEIIGVDVKSISFNKNAKPGEEFIKVKRKPEGLGDVVELITEVTGIKKAVEFFTDGKDCGCDKRKKWLNEKYNWKHPPCMEEFEYILWTDFLILYNKRLKKYDETNPSLFTLVTKIEVFEIDRLYRRLFRKVVPICANCKGGIRAIKNMISDINKVYNSYGKK